MSRRNLRALNTVVLLGAVIVVCMVYLGITSGVSIGSGTSFVTCPGGGCTVVLTPTSSVNPVQTFHTLTATTNGGATGVPIWFSVISSSAKICQGGTNAGADCLVDSACDLGSGVCTAGFCVGGTNSGSACPANDCDPGSGVCNNTGGGNSGALFNPNPCYTSGNPGSCTSTYFGGTTSTVDLIQACGDFSTTTQGVSDDVSYADCASNNDTNSAPDVLSNIVYKTWLENFVTGGGRIGANPKKPTHTFGGNWGPNPVQSPDCLAQWQINDHGATKEACHFNSCSFQYCQGGTNKGQDCVSSDPDCPTGYGGFDPCVELDNSGAIFSGPCTTSPPSNHNTGRTYIRGTCNNGDTVQGVLTVYDKCEGQACKTTPDQIEFDCNVVNSSLNACTNLGFPSNPANLTGGNLQVHQTPVGTCP